MKWTIALILAAIAVAVLVQNRVGRFSRKEAVAHLKSRALVVTVGSRAEFKSGHEPDAIDAPLDKLEAAHLRRLKDKEQVLLLHCQSGIRGSMAKKRLERLGYANAFNLGSYSRATQLLSSK